MPVFRTHEGSFVIIKRETTSSGEPCSPVTTPFTTISTPTPRTTGENGKRTMVEKQVDMYSSPRAVVYQSPPEQFV